MSDLQKQMIEFSTMDLVDAVAEEHVFHTDITFVHVDKDGRKQPI